MLCARSIKPFRRGWRLRRTQGARCHDLFGETATTLRQAGLKVEIHDDHFVQDASDEEWLTAVGKSNWIVLAKVERFTIQLETLIAHGVRAFVLTAPSVGAREMAAIFLRARGKIEKFLAAHSGPLMVAVARCGSLRVLCPKHGSKK